MPNNKCEVRIWTVVVAVVTRWIWYSYIFRDRMSTCCLCSNCVFWKYL